MLQEIVRNNLLHAQNQSPDCQESEQEEEEELDDIPLDLSVKSDAEPALANKQSLTKYTKTVLTPLSELELAKYRYINTSELVQAVKDLLSRYSISQRYFGDKVLGLSQGSVR
jgi:hypothetical protein